MKRSAKKGEKMSFHRIPPVYRHNFSHSTTAAEVLMSKILKVSLAVIVTIYGVTQFWTGKTFILAQSLILDSNALIHWWISRRRSDPRDLRLILIHRESSSLRHETVSICTPWSRYWCRYCFQWKDKSVVRSIR